MLCFVMIKTAWTSENSGIFCCGAKVFESAERLHIVYEFEVLGFVV